MCGVWDHILSASKYLQILPVQSAHWACQHYVDPCSKCVAFAALKSKSSINVWKMARKRTNNMLYDGNNAIRFNELVLLIWCNCISKPMYRHFENISLINLIDFDNKVHFISKDIISINEFQMRYSFILQLVATLLAISSILSLFIFIHFSSR